MSDDGIDSDSFRDMMASVAASVTVVTAYSHEGPIGLTVSAFTSVSMHPPIVLICIDKDSASLDAFISGQGFTVNFLPEGEGEVAMLFASRGADKFGSVEWQPPSVGGAGPVLDVAFGAFECQSIERTDMGDHWVIFGKVLSSSRASQSAPLLWLGRGFVRIEDAR